MLVKYAYTEKNEDQSPDWHHDHFTVVAGGSPYSEIVVTMWRTDQKPGDGWDNWVCQVKGIYNNVPQNYSYLGTAYPKMRKDHSKRPGYRWVLKQLGIKVIK